MNLRSDLVTVFVVRPDERATSHEFLQLQRAANDYLGQTWQLVRGCIEADETAVAAALRELREEAGMTPLQLYSLGPVESFYLWHTDSLCHSISFCAVVDRAAPVVLNDEHDDFRWVPRRRIDRELMWASERRLLGDLCRDVLDGGIASSRLRVDLD